MPVSVLIVDDDRAVAEFCRVTLTSAGHSALVVHSTAEALAALDGREIEVVLTDVRMPGTDGLGLLRTLNASGRGEDVVLMTAFGTIESAVEAVKLGAYDYLEKPFSPDRLATTIRRLEDARALRAQNTLLQFRLTSRGPHLGLVGASAGLMAVLASVLRVDGRRHPVLISGETGTGKELVARAIHERGPGPDQPFVAVDCGALSTGVIESELFGHVRGAYTGAVGDRRGLLATSAGGTLFLDEVGELPWEMQTKFLRVLQDRQFRPLGGDRLRPFDGRVIAATNRDLEKAVAENAFRPELYFRLNVHQIHVPPLGERREDIPLLIQHFIEKHGEGRVLTITRDASEALAGREWPGNVRELENSVIRFIAGCEGRVLDVGDISPLPRRPADSAAGARSTLEEAERQAIAGALKNAGGKVAGAAAALGVSKATLYRKMASHGLNGRKNR